LKHEEEVLKLMREVVDDFGTLFQEYAGSITIASNLQLLNAIKATTATPVEKHCAEQIEAAEYMIARAKATLRLEKNLPILKELLSGATDDIVLAKLKVS
jgi:hypothetical protein